MADLDNNGRGRRFRELVSIVLDRDGVKVQAKPRARSLAEAVHMDERMSSDVLLPDIALTISATRSLYKISELVDAAERASVADRRAFSAAVIYRPERPPRQQFVVTTLGVLADLAAHGLNPQTGDKP